MNRAWINPVALATLLILVVATSRADERRFEKKFPVAPGGTFTLSVDVGDVTVVGTAANEVSIIAHMRGTASDLEDVEVTAYETDEGVEVRARGKRSGWWFWDSFNMDLRFEVQTPREYNLRLTTSGGDIKISSVEGKIHGKTSGGDLHVNDIKGEVDLRTSGGDIRGERLSGDLRMGTSGGDIAIMAATGSVEVETSGGDIRISDVNGNVRAETSGGDVIVQVKNGNQGVHAATSGGDVEISVAKDVAANIDASTSGGSVTCDLPVTVSGKIEEDRIKGTVNGGGNVIYARTSGGNVRIHPAE